jgi:hypothetical protein
MNRMASMLNTFLLMGFFLMIAAHVSEPIQEDDPGWNCYAHGNHVCAAPELEATAWQAWDASHKAETLDNSRAHRVEYVGAAIIKPTPNADWITVSWEDGRWYVFRAEYI